MALLDQLNWRHAVKAYDPTRKLSAEDLNKILEAIRLTPTSSGLQPFKVFVVESQELKDKISEQVSNVDCARECSQILVFAAWDRYTDERIDKVFEQVSQERNRPTSPEYPNFLKNLFGKQLSAEQNFNHAAHQTYIAMGIALAQAAELGIDSTPIEGFKPAHVDEVLGLRAKGLCAVSMIYLGYRDESRDWMAPLKKVRRSADELFEIL